MVVTLSFLLIVAQAPVDTSGLAGSGSFVERVGRFVARMETAEQRGELTPGMLGDPPALLPTIIGAETRVREYIAANPDDVALLILAARLGRLKQLAQPVVYQGDSPPLLDTLVPAFAVNLRYLARAIDLQPTNAEAHYWMSRMYGYRTGWQRFYFAPISISDSMVRFFRTTLDSAVFYGQRAVALEPRQEQYREITAQWLVLTGRFDEAAETTRPLANGRHPITVLIDDRKLIPAPPGAVWDQARVNTIAEVREQAGIPLALLRVQAFILPQPAAEAEAFYKTRWPSMRFFDQAEQRVAPIQRALGQYLRIKGSGANVTLEPSTKGAEVTEFIGKLDPPSGFIIGLYEVTNAPEALRAQLPVDVGTGTFTIVSIINMRKL